MKKSEKNLPSTKIPAKADPVETSGQLEMFFAISAISVVFKIFNTSTTKNNQEHTLFFFEISNKIWHWRMFLIFIPTQKTNRTKPNYAVFVWYRVATFWTSCKRVLAFRDMNMWHGSHVMSKLGTVEMNKS